MPVEDQEEAKQTNEIGMFIPLLDGIDIQGKDITADALLTQRKLAAYVVSREAHYHFTVKGNQPTLQADIALLFRIDRRPTRSSCHPLIMDASKPDGFGAVPRSIPMSISRTLAKSS